MWERICRRAAACTLALVLVACGDPQEVLQSGTYGADGRTGDVLLRGVRVQGPDGHRLATGGNATVWLRLINERGSEELLSVSSDTASAVEIRWDRACDGTAETVSSLPLPAAGGVTDDDPAGADEFAPYHLRLVGLTRDVPVGTTVPLTFDFAIAPSVTVEVPVVPDTDVQAYPSTTCSSTG